MADEKRVIIKIVGRVQGVTFRYFLKKKARKLGLNGFVKNQLDGSVLVVAEGDMERIKKLIIFCRRGPVFARVEKVYITWKGAIGEFNDFVIHYS